MNSMLLRSPTRPRLPPRRLLPFSPPKEMTNSNEMNQQNASALSLVNTLGIRWCGGGVNPNGYIVMGLQIQVIDFLFVEKKKVWYTRWPFYTTRVPLFHLLVSLSIYPYSRTETEHRCTHTPSVRGNLFSALAV